MKENSLRYLWAGLRYPESSELGFLRSSVGIEKRSRVFAPTWEPHLERCRAVERLWGERVLARSKSGLASLAVVGAGRLLDFDSDFFASTVRRLQCIDADPLSVSSWRQLKRRHPEVVVESRVFEVTGRIARWNEWWKGCCSSNSFDDALVQLSQMREDLTESGKDEGGETGQPAGPSPLRRLFLDTAPGAVVSLNMLSQIPVMWQDLVLRELVARFGKEQVDSREDDWVGALVPSARSLVRGHLRDLFTSGARSILLITDLEYLCLPKVEVISPGETQAAPRVQWVRGDEGDGYWELISKPEGSRAGTTATGDWCQRIDALYDTPLSNRKLRDVLADGYEHELLDEWTWNICPVHDATGESVFHRVAAIAFWAK